MNLLQQINERTKLSESALNRAKEVQKILGSVNIVEAAKLVKEEFDHTIGQDDYVRWLEAIQQMSAEDGTPINKKADFTEYAMTFVLDQDPVFDLYPDAEEMKVKVVNALWQAAKASKAHAGIEQLNAKVRDRVRQEEEVSGFAQTFNAAKGIEDEQELDLDLEDQENQDDDSNPHPMGSLSAAMWDGEDGGDSEVEDLKNQVNALQARLDRLEDVEREEGHDLDGIPLDDTDDEVDAEVQAAADRVVGDTPEEFRVGFSDEEKQKGKGPSSLLTIPREEVNQAVKDVEAAGADAWHRLQLPVNPHPPKTAAHAAFERGMRKAAQGIFGFKPPVVKAKKKR